MQNTTDIKRRLHEIRSAAESKEAADQQGALKVAIEKNKAVSHEFLGGFTEAQRTGLKKLIRKLGKTNEELTKAVEIAIQEVAQAGDGTKRTAKLEKAEEASQNLLNEQKQLAAEMGINLQ
jgi:NCAIR mutase (PurE)-related protein